MKTATTPTATPRSRCPKGVDSVLRINISLMPEERGELLLRATQDGRTYSAMARIFLLRGMQADPNFSPSSTGVSGGSASNDPAAFSLTPA